MYKEIEINYGIQVIFSTIPNQKDINFEDDVEKNYFNDYKNAIKSNKEDILYKPLKFYTLGDYDVCYISLINNFKFSHRLFEPKHKEDNSVYVPHTFQSFAGFALNNEETLQQIFSNTDNQKYFAGIINLKLNNGLLIGNGLTYIEAVFNYLSSELKDIPFLLMQTFSWFELSLVVFVDDPAQLTCVLTKIRLSEFKDLLEDNLKNSLYHSYFESECPEKILNTSLFSDTHTYFGFNKNLICEAISSPYISDFINFIKQNDIKLKTDIEWQVKPGHILQLEKIISEHPDLKSYFSFDNRKIVLGKCDYLLPEINESILSNFYLLRYINQKNEKCALFEHARKVRSYVFLDARDLPIRATEKETPLSWDEKLDRLAVPSKTFYKTDKLLKELKVSRQVRIKVLKIFSNYNNGIQDPILFPYFLDFTIFIRNLIELIQLERDKARKGFFKLKELEKKLNENIKVFQEGYNVRFLNGYQFENISDFDLDFNSSIQQLLTSYGSFVYEYGKLFYDDEKYAPIIQLNNIDTVSNNLSINYSIQHLTSPEFVFTTLLKEILNHLQSHNETFKNLLNNFFRELPQIRMKINESYLDDMFDSDLVDINNFIIDAIRYIVTFNGDFELFKHWFWTYNFQNSSLYDSGGMFNEEHLRVEMCRIMLVREFYGLGDAEMICPTPELFTYWTRHYTKIEFIANKLAMHIKEQKIGDFIQFIANKYLDSFEEQTYSPNMEMLKYITFIDRLEYFNKDLQKKKLSFLFSRNSSSDEMIHYLEKLVFDKLNFQYDKNNEKITLLKRDWLSGKTLNNHNSLYKDIFYAIDQTGGVYFYDNKKMTSYFKMNAECLLAIIDFSYKQKKQFILEKSR